jgi:hypothetical protein
MATPALAADTGWKSPTANSTIGGSFCNPANAHTSNDQWVEYDSSSDVNSYYGFGFTIPSGSAINGIEVLVEGKRSCCASKTWDVSLSCDGGSSWTAPKNTGSLQTSDTTITLGTASDSWGYGSWTSAIINSDNFRVRMDATSGCDSIYLDCVQVKVYYTPPNPVPTISSFTPTLGGTGTSVVITGTNFISGATTVKFGGTDASSVTFNSATQITAVVGSGATGTVSVTTPGGTAISSDTFTVDTTPPSTAVVTDDGVWANVNDQLHAVWASADAETGISEYQYAIGITAGGTDIVVWTSTGTTASVTETGLSLSDGQIYYFTVRARNGAGLWSAVGNSDGITVDTTPPTIIYNSPSAGGQTAWYSADPGNVIDIDFGWVANSPLDYAKWQSGSSGWNFIFEASQSSNYTDNWGITWASLAEGDNNVSIRVADAAGNLVTQSYVAGTSGFIFRKSTTVPAITSISPTTGSTNGGTPITITGTNFISGATTVTIGGNPATSVVVVNATTITAVTPPGTAGAKDVVVTTPGGTAPLACGFTYETPAPPAWFDPDWEYRKPITINSDSVVGVGDLSYFPIVLDSNDSEIIGGAQGDFDDLVATDANNNRLPLEVEISDSGEVVAWVDISSLPSGYDTTIYLYYGNDAATEPPPGSTYGSQSVWDDGYIGVWHLEDSSAINDSTSHANHGTATDCDSIEGITGEGLDLNGTSSYVYIPNSDNLSIIGDKLTIEVWAYIDTLTSATLISKGDAYALGITSGEELTYTLNTSGGLVSGETSDANLAISTWYQFVLVYDGSSVKLYISDETNGTRSYNMGSVTGTIENNSELLLFGTDSVPSYYNGRLDEVHISDIVRPVDWFGTGYSNQSNPDGFYTIGAQETVLKAEPLGPTADTGDYVSGIWDNDISPTLPFTQYHNKPGATVKYRIQIDNDSDFSSPVVDYMSSLMAPGDISFTVGQAKGSGTYLAGNAGQILANGPYYWRVMSIDNEGNESGWAVANGGQIAFLVRYLADDFETEEVDLATSDNVTVTNEGTNDDTEVIISGSGTADITIARYTQNPGGSAPSGTETTDSYIDVYASDISGLTEVEIRHYYLDSEIVGVQESTLRMYYQTPSGEWAVCSNTGVNTNTVTFEGVTYSGYIWAILNATTTPTLNYLMGSAFVGVGLPADDDDDIPAGGGGGGGGGEVKVSSTTNLLSVDMLGWTSKVQVTNDGIIVKPSTIVSLDESLTLKLDMGTKINSSENKVPMELALTVAIESPPIPEGMVLVSQVYDCIAFSYGKGMLPVTFNPPATLVINYNPEAVPENISSLFIAYYDAKLGWVPLDAPGGFVAEAGTEAAQVSHFTPFAVLARLTTLSPVSFEVSNLDISPGQVETGVEVIISAQVANIGGMSGEYTLMVNVDGLLETSQVVELIPGQSQELSFTVTPDTPGSYQVEIGGLQASFVVVAPPPSPSAEAGKFKWLTPWLIPFIAAIVLAALVFMPVRKRLQPVPVAGKPLPSKPVSTPSRVEKAMAAIAGLASTLVRKRVRKRRQSVIILGAPSRPVPAAEEQPQKPVPTAAEEQPRKPVPTAAEKQPQRPVPTAAEEQLREPVPVLSSVRDLRIIPNRVKAGGTIHVFAEITNNNPTALSFSLVLKVKGVVEALKEVTLDPGQSQRVAFIVLKDRPGIYDVDLEGLKDSFSVEI